MVTGHKYKIHWGVWDFPGLDWEDLKIGITDRWAPLDDPIYFVHNYTDTRVDYDVDFVGGPDKVRAKNDSIALSTRDYQTGQWVLFEDPEIREFHFVITGKYPVKDEAGFYKHIGGRYLKFKFYRCKVDCFPDNLETGIPCEETFRSWSNPLDWS